MIFSLSSSSCSSVRSRSRIRASRNLSLFLSICSQPVLARSSADMPLVNSAFSSRRMSTSSSSSSAFDLSASSSILKTSAVSSAISRSRVASSMALSCSACIASIDSSLICASFKCFLRSVFSCCWGWYLICRVWMILSNLSRSDCIFSEFLSFSRSSSLFFSNTRSLAFRSSISLAATTLLDTLLMLDVGPARVAGARVAVVGVPVSFSRAAVLTCTGLTGSGDRISSSLLRGVPAPLALPLADPPVSVPEAESTDIFLPAPDRCTGPLTAPVASRPLRVLAGAAAAPARADVDDTEVVRVGLDPGRGGGPIEIRVVPVAPPMEGRGGLATPRDARTLEGVAVRELEALDAAESCFVGDFVGDC